MRRGIFVSLVRFVAQSDECLPVQVVAVAEATLSGIREVGLARDVLLPEQLLEQLTMRGAQRSHLSQPYINAGLHVGDLSMSARCCAEARVGSIGLMKYGCSGSKEVTAVALPWGSSSVPNTAAVASIGLSLVESTLQNAPTYTKKLRYWSKTLELQECRSFD